MNFLHDIESVWWAFAWTFFYHTDMETANSYDSNSLNVHAQRNQYHIAFPDTIDNTSCRDFFTDTVRLQRMCKNFISTVCWKVCGDISLFANNIQENYRTAEANYPLLALDDDLLEIMDEQAAGHLCRAQCRAGDIGLCPLHDLLNPKRSRPKNETSLAIAPTRVFYYYN
jgi:hypothetical protein